MVKNLKYIKKKLAHMQGSKNTVEIIWRKISLLTSPETLYGLNHTTVTLKPRQLVQELVQSLSVAVTSATNRWFAINCINKNPTKEQMQFCKDLEILYYRVLKNSNIYSALNSVYEQLVIYGTSCILVEKDDDSIFRIIRSNPNDFWIQTGTDDKVEFFIRKVSFSAENAAKFFGNGTPQHVKEESENNPDCIFDFYQAIFKRDGKIRKNGLAKNKPYASIWFMANGDEILKESGYNYNPVILSRWETKTGKPYGLSPCIHALRLIEDINTAEILLKLRFQRETDKPLAFYGFTNKQVEDFFSGKIPGLSIPNTTTGTVKDTPQIIDILRYQDNFEKIHAYLLSLKQELADALYNDVLVAFRGQRTITATEAQYIQNEKILRMNSIINNLNMELLQPIMEIVGHCMEKYIPPIPSGTETEMELIGIFANKIKEQDLAQMKRFLEYAVLRGQAHNASPDMMKVAIDPIEESLLVADCLHIDPRIVRDGIEQAEIIKRAMQQQQEQMEKTK